jgi:hypothetical protein
MRRFIGDKPRAIAEATYKMFAKRYKISTSSGGRLKTMKELAQQIYNHERRTNVQRGLYFMPVRSRN